MSIEDSFGSGGLAIEKVPLGRYTHYKDSSKEYRVIAVGWIQKTMEQAVVYQALYDTPDLGSRPIFVRPLSNFTAMVLVNGKQVPRFTYIGE